MLSNITPSIPCCAALPIGPSAPPSPSRGKDTEEGFLCGPCLVKLQRAQGSRSVSFSSTSAALRPLCLLLKTLALL